MKKLGIFLLCFHMLLAAGCKSEEGANDMTADQKMKLEKDIEKYGYSIGFNIGKNLRPVASQVELAALLQGIKDGIHGDDKAQMTTADMDKAGQEFNMKAQQMMTTKRNVEGEKNKAEGAAFLAENAKKEGVKTTASGLQYIVTVEGTGPSPKETDKVKVHYRGTLLDGVEFDSSFKRNMPAEFPLNRVIRGWTEGVQLMKVGSKYKFFIPAELAYGANGAGQLIGPNATLIFELELLEIMPPEAAAPQQ